LPTTGITSTTAHVTAHPVSSQRCVSFEFLPQHLTPWHPSVLQCHIREPKRHEYPSNILKEVESTLLSGTCRRHVHCNTCYTCHLHFTISVSAAASSHNSLLRTGRIRIVCASNKVDSVCGQVQQCYSSRMQHNLQIQLHISCPTNTNYHCAHTMLSPVSSLATSHSCRETHITGSWISEM
jgi:hypothetical protein